MEAYRVKATVSQDGKLTIQDLSLRAGDQVEVIILRHRKREGANRYPLRGKPVRYVAPFDGVAEEEWGALQ